MITSAYEGDGPIHAFREFANRDRFGIHSITDDPDEADVILFVEHHRQDDDRDFARLTANSYVQRYKEKCFMYNEQDRPWCVLPGLYTCMPRRLFSRQRQRASSYLHILNPYVRYSVPNDQEADVLFSFVGRPNCKVRRAILDLKHDRGHIVRTSTTHNAWQRNGPPDDPDLPMRTYARMLQRSKFVLCPRGLGTSSYRLLETMQTGRVPVILANQWVPPDGPDWNRCSLRVNESDVDHIPELLEAEEARWTDMATAARSEWETWFAPDVLFHRWAEACAHIRADRRIPELVSQRLPQPVYIERRVRGIAGKILSVLCKS